MYVLFNIIIAFALFAVDAAVIAPAVGAPVVYLLYALATFLPGLAVAVRRLHDTDRSGWFLLVAFVPFVGGLILLIFLVEEGTRGRNQYGRDPKARRRRDDYYGDYEEEDEEEDERPRSRRRVVEEDDEDDDDRPPPRRRR